MPNESAEAGRKSRGHKQLSRFGLGRGWRAVVFKVSLTMRFPVAYKLYQHTSWNNRKKRNKKRKKSKKKKKKTQ